MGKFTPTIARFDQYLIFFTHTSFQEDDLLLIYKNTFSSLSRASLIRSIDVA
jgi:hypothetical protein